MYWRGPRPGERTILGLLVESDELYGYGTWKHRDIKFPDGTSEPVIDIPFFGVQAHHHGAVDPEGRKVAGVFYATLEAAARLESPEGMRVHLACDVRNIRGHRFWERMGFRDADRLDFDKVSYMRMFR